MPPSALMASSAPWPAMLLGVAVVVAVCLWLLFRPGSMADRARLDHPDDEPVDEHRTTGDGGDGEVGQAPDGGR